MARLKLWISDLNLPQLHRTRFDHPQLAQPLTCVRGKKDTLFGDSGTFQWTPAVQALTLLLIRTAAAGGGLPRPILEGERGSPGSSLGYILLKKPDWLREMFGELRPGVLIISRLLRTHNPGLRRPGSMAIGFHDHADLEIQVRIEDRQIVEKEQLERLADKIEAQWRPHRSGAGSRRPPAEEEAAAAGGQSGELRRRVERITPAAGPKPENDFSTVVSRMLEHECRARLWKTDIFTAKSRDAIIEEIYSQPLFAQVVGRKIDLLHPADRSLSTAERLGISGGEKDRIPAILGRQKRPLSVALPVISAAVKACFYHLRYTAGAPIDLHEGFTHSGDILSYLRRSAPGQEIDFIPLGVGTAAEVLSHPEDFPYLPFMLLPKHSLRIVSPKGSRNASIKERQLNWGNYVITGDGPTSPRFALDELLERGSINRSRIKLSFAEPDESFQQLKTGDPEIRSLLFFPHYNFNCLWNDCRLLGENEERHQTRDTLLMVHKRLAGEIELLRAFDIMLRDAWLTLRSDDAALRNAVSRIVAAPGFIETMKRSAGLYSVPPLLDKARGIRVAAEKSGQQRIN